jgi:hypothetical protein
MISMVSTQKTPVVGSELPTGGRTRVSSRHKGLLGG